MTTSKRPLTVLVLAGGPGVMAGHEPFEHEVLRRRP